ncbi:hypothetical protein PFICI_00899 [Pestalotiopsis fici W106-1]|uniref:Prion-inhibition and propagation HeLo domain-containing protein n=1 Tax=Pestalotiopsis fici (strain W106-1 / CGMCC3.15140) TaxID=1229662 RepID=W3XP70_PESFW|nr:uncharacterized protein PFICI_00899 [Pestalotiopsis fici W106-1]ETS87071.1 hypothetical protein PFICI_00899 [Pestalotiopsis fici W106-1]
MDAASLILGILPLVAGAIKGYGVLKKKSDIFRHYSRELKRIQKSLNVERDVFLCETETMVLAAIDDYSLVGCMIEDPDHPQWRSTTVEESFKEVLGRSYDEYYDTIKSISQAIQEIQTELDCFDASERHVAEKQKEVFQRLRDRFKASWKQPTLEGSLASLTRCNGSLQRLGKQARKIQEMLAKKTVTDGPKKQLPRNYEDFELVRRASKAVYLALSNAWSSQNGGRQPPKSHQHDVRFFLNTTVIGSMSMELLVACSSNAAREANAPNNHPISQPLRLEIKSEVIQRVDFVPQSHSNPISAIIEEGQPKQRKVRFQDDDTHRMGKESPPATRAQQDAFDKSHIPNLLDRDLCSFLHQTASRTGKSACTECVGYLDSWSDETFRHSIYDVVPSAFDLASVVSIQQLLDSYSAERCVRMVDQLKLALSLVAAVLKFHSTPWLAQYVTLRNVSLFHTSQDFEEWLPTLHFDTTFVDNRPQTLTEEQEAVGKASQGNTTDTMARVIENAKFDHGIRNMTLWCLGVILLQVGHWSRIAEPDDVRAVRQLSWEPTDFGEDYEELTRRVLECDFGFGGDLSQVKLQRAVYERVYLELASMIDKVDIPRY